MLTCTIERRRTILEGPHARGRRLEKKKGVTTIACFHGVAVVGDGVVGDGVPGLSVSVQSPMRSIGRDFPTGDTKVSQQAAINDGAQRRCE